MNFSEWLKRLEAHGSTDDPIWSDGVESTPSKLTWEKYGPLESVSHIKIEYMGGRPLRRIKGSPMGMLRDRARGARVRTLAPQKHMKKDKVAHLLTLVTTNGRLPITVITRKKVRLDYTDHVSDNNVLRIGKHQIILGGTAQFQLNVSTTPKKQAKPAEKESTTPDYLYNVLAAAKYGAKLIPDDFFYTEDFEENMNSAKRRGLITQKSGMRGPYEALTPKGRAALRELELQKKGRK